MLCYGRFQLGLISLRSAWLHSRFVDSLFSYMFIALINRSTRLTLHSPTLIDHLFTNYPSQNTANGVIFNYMLDNLLTV